LLKEFLTTFLLRELRDIRELLTTFSLRELMELLTTFELRELRELLTTFFA